MKDSLYFLSCKAEEMTSSTELVPANNLQDDKEYITKKLLLALSPDSQKDCLTTATEMPDFFSRSNSQKERNNDFLGLITDDGCFDVLSECNDELQDYDFITDKFISFNQEGEKSDKTKCVDTADVSTQSNTTRKSSFEDFTEDLNNVQNAKQIIDSHENTNSNYELTDNVIFVIDSYMNGTQLSDTQKIPLNKIEKSFVEFIETKKNQSNKKSEEKIKIFMRPAFKHLTEMYFRAQLAKSKKKLTKKDKNIEGFYEYYFEETAKELGVDIQNFYQPIRSNATKKLLSPSQKTFNITFLNLTLNSKKFREDLQNYLTNVFMVEYQEKRKKKIRKLLLSCKKQLEQQKKEGNYTEDSLINSLKEHILKNSKTKIAWSDEELLDAADFVQNIMNTQHILQR